MSSWPSPEVEEVALAWCSLHRPHPSEVATLRALAQQEPEAFVRAVDAPDIGSARFPVLELKARVESEAGRPVVMRPFVGPAASAAASYFAPVTEMRL